MPELPLLFSSSYLILHSTLCLSLTVLLSFLKIPALVFYGIHTYVHPDDVTPNSNNSNNSRGGLKAAIRRPGVADSEVKVRKNSKDKFEFDENKAQIFRLKLNHAQLESRVYFSQFSGVFNSTVVALCSILLHSYLKVDFDSGIVKNGTVIPILLVLVAFFKLFFLIARVCFERSASKRSEKLLSVVFGIVGFFWGMAIVFEMVPRWFFRFDFGSLDGFGRFCIAVSMGCVAGLFYIPATRNARAFWLGTDQIRCKLSMISCGGFARMFLHVSFAFSVFTSMLWIGPFAEVMVIRGNGAMKVSHSAGRRNGPVGRVGMSRSDFEMFRFWCLLISGILQVLCLRPNVQMFLNEAVLCWYQRLHGSRVPDLEYSRAKVFLHNHYMFLVVLQFFAPAAMVLLLTGSSHMKFDWLCAMFSHCGVVKEVALFLAWWIIIVWSTFTSFSLTLYRRGLMFVS